MGDNCYPFLFEMAKDSDITIMIEHLIPLVKQHIGEFTMNRENPVIDYWDFDEYCHNEHDRWNHYMGFDDQHTIEACYNANKCEEIL